MAGAQPYYIKHYQVENGLSNNAVITCLQDQKGFLWFGTKDGLNRFDGYTFKTFRTHAAEKGSLGNNFIHCLYEDRQGKMWVGTEKGLYQYDPLTEQFSVINATANLQISEIVRDKQNNIWFVSGFILFKYIPQTEKLETYAAPQFFEATSVCVAPDGGIWTSTADGLLKKYDAATNTFESFNVYPNSTTTSKWIEKIYSTRDGHLLIGTAKGAKLFNIHTGIINEVPTANPDKTDLFVRNFLQTSDDEIWIGTESGIFIYNTKGGTVTNLRKKYNDPYSLSDNAVYTFCIDREGGIWAGTYFGGVNYFPKAFTPFNKFFPKVYENSISGNVVREMVEDNDGNLWIGTEDAGLNKLHTATGQITHFGPSGNGSLSYSNIHGLLAHKDELWIGTFEHGLDVMNTKTGKVVKQFTTASQPAFKSNFIYSIYKSAEGEIIIGTTIGAYVYEEAKSIFTPVNGMPVYNWYTSFLKDKYGILWACTFGNGINYVDTKTGKSGNLRYNAADKNSIGSDRVNAVFKDHQNNLWFATEGGLCKLNYATKTFDRYTTNNGFPSNFTLAVLEDEKNNLWVSTTKGLVCFNPQTSKTIVYTTANGLLSDQFNYSAAFKDKNGQMFFGSAKGLISFNPREFKENRFVPPVYITGFQVFNKELPIAQQGSPLQQSITYTDKITLNYKQSTFSIDFSALGYTAPQMLEYAYKMNGLQRDWTYLKTNRKVYFTDLSAGTYKFIIKASSGNGVFNGNETTLLIQILPPWWASWWAYALYATAALLLFLYSIHNYRKKMASKNRRKIEQLKAAKEKELYEAKIEFFTNVAHEIRTPLTLIKGPLEKIMRRADDMPEIQKSLNIMDRNTRRLLDLTNQLLDFRQTEIKGFRLNFTEANISDLLDETYAGFQPLAEQKQLAYHISLPPAPVYAAIDTDAFNKILTNLFSNAIKYADRAVSVRLVAGNDKGYFTIEVQNDGYLIPLHMKEKIFEPFFRLKETEKQKGTGIGLALSRSLTLLHNGELKLKASNEATNIFELRLPIQQQTYCYKQNTQQAISPSSVNSTI